MSFTRTINYTQNVPVNLGFTNYLNPTPSRTVTCTFVVDYYAAGLNLGNIIVPTTAGVTVKTGRAGINGSSSGSTVLTGEVSAVNTALNGCEWISNFYEIEDVDQDFLALTRSFGNQKGEMQIQIPSAADISSMPIGTAVTFSTMTGGTGAPYQFTVTKIDTVNSATRLWLIYNRDYKLSDEYFSGVYKNVNVTTTPANVCYLKTVAGVNIAPVIDIAYGNPQGTIQTLFRVNDGATVEDNSLTLAGSPQIAEPTFSSLPPTSVATGSPQTWYQLSSQFGTIAQADNNYQSVQLLFKASTNDPKYLGVTDYTLLPGYPSGGTTDAQLLFIGNAINALASLDIPTYIKDKTYGAIGDTQVDLRASVSYVNDNQEVRWSYYDTPAGCNDALSRVFYWRPTGFNKDFNIETRIVNGKSRIYANRGL